MEITKQLAIDESDGQILNNHSILNILNLLQYNFLLLSDLLNDDKILLHSYSSVQELALLVSKKSVGRAESQKIRHLYSLIMEDVQKAAGAAPECGRDRALTIVATIEKIVEILNIRLDELEKQNEAGPDSWLGFTPLELESDMLAFFRAVEQNSRGAYKFVDNIALKDDTSYFIDLQFHASNRDKIHMPLLIKDAFRDLIANARKYSDPGGNILGGIFQDAETLRLVVEDNGRGIPEESIESVVDFGVRAENARYTTSYGGGFGLTKAYYITKKFGGRMWIESEINYYTRVKIIIPNQSSIL